MRCSRFNRRAVFRRERIGDRFEADQCIGRDVQRTREIHQQRARRLRALGFVIRNDALRDAGRVAQFRLCQATTLPERREAGTKTIECREDCSPSTP